MMDFLNYLFADIQWRDASSTIIVLLFSWTMVRTTRDLEKLTNLVIRLTKQINDMRAYVFMMKNIENNRKVTPDIVDKIQEDILNEEIERQDDVETEKNFIYPNESLNMEYAKVLQKEHEQCMRDYIKKSKLKKPSQF